jgi:hypothetical protein
MSYFPVLRARLYELIALRERADLISENAIIPVIEPVTVQPLSNNLPQFVGAGMEFCLIVNPRVPKGNPLSHASVFTEIVEDVLDEYEGFRPTLYVNGQTQPADIQAFSSRYAPLSLPRAYFLTSDPSGATTQAITQDDPIYVLCRAPQISAAKRNSFDLQTRVLIEDPFHQQNNADYPPSESFSDRHLGTVSGDYAHFGDYSMIGDVFKETGGLPFAVAIHYMTARQTDQALELRHYVSDQNATRGKTAEKFLEALQKLINDIGPLGVANRTLVTDQLEQLYQQQHSPGLPTLKKLGIQRHIELMATLL